MHIIFGNVRGWQILLLKVLSYLKIKIFYLYIDAKTEDLKNKIAAKLKKNQILPLPIEFEKKITPKASYSLFLNDPNEIAYKKNLKIVPEKILQKYSDLFSIKKGKEKKLRLLIQDFISAQQRHISAKLGIWSALYPEKKIIYINFKFSCFYISDTGKNIYKIIIPLDIFIYLFKIFKKVCGYIFSFLATKKNQQKDEFLYNNKIQDPEAFKVALVTHKGLNYGGEQLLFEKSLYYSKDLKSSLNKSNILHLDYSNFSKPEENINWVCLNKIKINEINFLLNILKACVKTFYLVRNWQMFIGWVFCMRKYGSYIRYKEILKRFKNIKIALIDHDYLCPKSLILALEKNSIQTIGTQDRFITVFYKSYVNVILHTYFVASEFAAKIIKNSKYCEVEDVVPVGQYRSEYIPLYKNEIIPAEISVAKKLGKKILVVLGNHTTNNWYESYSEPYLNWSAQINFLKDFIKLSKDLKNTLIVLRYKKTEWLSNLYFKDIVEEINNSENITISNNYKEAFYSYKLCTNADLVIARHTSLADECLLNEIPVLFHEYSHNMEKIVLEVSDYLPTELICKNYKELYQKSNSILFLNSDKLKEKIKELNNKIYYVAEAKNIKSRIINNLESQISNNRI